MAFAANVDETLF